MRTIFLFLAIVLGLFVLPACAEEDANGVWITNLSAQARLDRVGFGILNANELDKRAVFSYNSKKSRKLLDSALYKRQVTVTDEELAHCATEDELAALLARKIALVMKSYDGALNGLGGTFQAAFSPKKYELIADKRAVEYVVKAGYNPLGLITFINKTCPQKRRDTFSKHNLTSKRMMYIYEYIYSNCPYFLAYNDIYIKNKYYQNFLLNSFENRKKLEEKLKSGDYSGVKYE